MRFGCTSVSRPGSSKTPAMRTAPSYPEMPTFASARYSAVDGGVPAPVAVME